jgi:hypothetical protein
MMMMMHLRVPFFPAETSTTVPASSSNAPSTQRNAASATAFHGTLRTPVRAEKFLLYHARRR